MGLIGGSIPMTSYFQSSRSMIVFTSGTSSSHPVAADGSAGVRLPSAGSRVKSNHLFSANGTDTLQLVAPVRRTIACRPKRFVSRVESGSGGTSVGSDLAKLRLSWPEPGADHSHESESLSVKVRSGSVPSTPSASATSAGVITWHGSARKFGEILLDDVAGATSSDGGTSRALDPHPESASETDATTVAIAALRLMLYSQGIRYGVVYSGSNSSILLFGLSGNQRNSEDSFNCATSGGMGTARRSTSRHSRWPAATNRP